MSAGSDHPTLEFQLDFLGRVQRLLEAGAFTASYKFALLQALADLAVERGSDTDARLELDTRDLADRFIDLYWRQSLPFPTGSRELEPLRQNKGRQASVVRRLEEARRLHGDSLTGIQNEPRSWRQLVTRVERTIREMPLWKLQRIAGEVDDFLYPQQVGSRKIVLRKGVTYCLRRFYPLITDLVRGAWIRFVRDTNASLLGSNVDLHAWLFGTERDSLQSYRPILEELQHGRCFCCNARLKSSSDVDHFVPWSKYPVDLGHNFVLADKRCNSAKADYLADEAHLMRWVERNRAKAGELLQHFDSEGLPYDEAASLSVVRWAYSQADRMGSRVWHGAKQFQVLDGSWRELLGAAEVATVQLAGSGP